MVNSSKPSPSQSRRGPAPRFSKGNTRKIPCGAESSAFGLTDSCAGLGKAAPRKPINTRTRGKKKRRCFIAKIVADGKTSPAFTWEKAANQPCLGPGRICRRRCQHFLHCRQLQHRCKRRIGFHVA